MQIFHRSIAHFFEKLLHLRRLAVLIIGVIASEPTAPLVSIRATEIVARQRPQPYTSTSSVHRSTSEPLAAKTVRWPALHFEELMVEFYYVNLFREDY